MKQPPPPPCSPHSSLFYFLHDSDRHPACPLDFVGEAVGYLCSPTRVLTPEGRQSVGLTRCLEEGLGRSVICGWVNSLLRKEIFNDDSYYYKVAKSVQNLCTSRTLTWVLVVRTH